MIGQDQAERPQRATEVAQRFELSDAGRQLLVDDAPPASFFAELAQAELYEDAIRFAAHYLTPREAVWWGCLCTWQAFRKQPPAAEARTLDVVSRWVIEPSEERRRAAHRQAHTAGLSYVASHLALAAFYSGGSISLADQPHVDPPADQSARAVAAGVLLACRKVANPFRSAYPRHCLKLAGDVSRGEAQPVPPPGTAESDLPQEEQHAPQT